MLSLSRVGESRVLWAANPRNEPKHSPAYDRNRDAAIQEWRDQAAIEVEFPKGHVCVGSVDIEALRIVLEHLLR